MKQWFAVDEATGRIKGYVRSGKATVLPTPPAGRVLVEATDEKIEEFEELSRTARSSGRGDGVLIDLPTGNLSLPPDPRFFLDISVDVTHRVAGDPHVGEVIADGVDTAVVSFTALNANGTVRTGFNARRKADLFGRIVALQFVNGIATKNFRTRTSSRFEISSHPLVRLQAPFVLEAVVEGDLGD